MCFETFPNAHIAQIADSFVFYVSHLLQKSFTATTFLLASVRHIVVQKINYTKNFLFIFLNVCHYVADQVFGILNKSDTNMRVGFVIKSH